MSKKLPPPPEFSWYTAANRKKQFEETKVMLSKSVPEDFTPLTHNEDIIIIQLHGWSINLYPDGRWIWEATDGG